MTNLFLNIIVPVMPHVSSGNSHHCVNGGVKDLLAIYIGFCIISLPGTIHYIYSKFIKRKELYQCSLISFFSFIAFTFVNGMLLFVLLINLIKHIL